MLFSLSPTGCRLEGKSKLHIPRRLPLWVGIFLILSVGCSMDSGPAPGVTYACSIVTKGAGGKVTPHDSEKRIEGAVVEATEELTYEGNTFSLQVLKTQFGKSTFEISFPDKSKKKVQVKAGEVKDSFPKGKNVGVRIEVLDSH
jgi:hypothetical protein